MTVKTTDHADYRARKRMGVSDVTRRFEDALALGTKVHDFKGAFGRYLTKQAIVHRSNGVVYHGHIYWFRGDTLITVIPLAQKWHKYIKKDQA